MRIFKIFHGFYSKSLLITTPYFVLVFFLVTAFGSYRELSGGRASAPLVLQCLSLTLVGLLAAPFAHSLALLVFPGLAEKKRAAEQPLALVAKTPPLLRPRQLLRRLNKTLAGASKADLFVDLLRDAAILCLVGFTVRAFLNHGGLLFSSTRFLITACAMGFSVVVICFHVFAYPLIRGRSMWDDAYSERKLMLANAINSATAALQAEQSPDSLLSAIRRTEQSSLKAIRSYLEHTVLDRSGGHFNVNLIVKHPEDCGRLVCIARSSRKHVPTFYELSNMPTARRVFGEGEPIYVSEFKGVIDAGKQYRMVWQVPISSLATKEPMGIVGIDSTVAHHLDLEDNRETLLYNITPYIAVLRYSLAFRERYAVWQDVLFVEGAAEEFAALVRVQPSEYHVDRNIDRESLAILAEWDDVAAQFRQLRKLANSVHKITRPRKLFSIFFPLVDANTRRFRL